MWPSWRSVNLRYQRPKNAKWIALTWRYDSGEVVSGVPDVAAAMALSAAQQTSIGFRSQHSRTRSLRAVVSVGQP
jgi:hypothetical protein